MIFFFKCAVVTLLYIQPVGVQSASAGAQYKRPFSFLCLRASRQAFTFLCSCFAYVAVTMMGFKYRNSKPDCGRLRSVDWLQLKL